MLLEGSLLERVTDASELINTTRDQISRYGSNIPPEERYRLKNIYPNLEFSRFIITCYLAKLEGQGEIQPEDLLGTDRYARILIRDLTDQLGFKLPVGTKPNILSKVFRY